MANVHMISDPVLSPLFRALPDHYFGYSSESQDLVIEYVPYGDPALCYKRALELGCDVAQVYGPDRLAFVTSWDMYYHCDWRSSATTEHTLPRVLVAHRGHCSLMALYASNIRKAGQSVSQPLLE